MAINNNINVGGDSGDINQNIGRDGSIGHKSKYSVVKMRWIGVMVSLVIILAFAVYYISLKYEFELARIKAEKVEDVKVEEGANEFDRELSEGFICENNAFDGTFFATDEDLLFPLKIIRIFPDSTYVQESGDSIIVDTLNSGYEDTYIQYKHVGTDTIYSSTFGTDVIDHKEMLSELDDLSTMTMIISPKGTVFKAEVQGGTKVNVLHGAALAHGAHTFFVRDEDAESHVVTHESSHCFGLKHLHEGRLPFVAMGYGCEVGDKIYSTPATGNGKYEYKKSTGECAFHSNDPDITEEEKNKIVSNVQSYTHPDCMGKLAPFFDYGQINFMRSYIEGSPSHRKILLGRESLMFTTSLFN